MPFILPFLLLLGQLQPLVIPGERLTYQVSSARFGDMGHAHFTVSTLESGNIALAFDFDARVLLFKASDHTDSELDPKALRTVRYTKKERSPVTRRDEDVTIDHVLSTWQMDGRSAPLATTDALDELSLIYLVRALELPSGQEVTINRHFDRARNPVRLRALASAGNLDVIEMTVPDSRQKSGRSVLRFHLSRDAGRMPMIIESTMPMAGRVTMTLVPAR
jgi:hypothetical protein